MIAPTVATRMDQMLNPDTPAPPKRLKTNPPTKAPTIPIRIVTMMPPGSSPGRTSFASAPAISPTIIHAIIPISSPLWKVRLRHVYPQDKRLETSCCDLEKYFLGVEAPGGWAGLRRGRKVP